MIMVGTTISLGYKIRIMINVLIKNNYFINYLISIGFASKINVIVFHFIHLFIDSVEINKAC